MATDGMMCVCTARRTAKSDARSMMKQYGELTPADPVVSRQGMLTLTFLPLHHYHRNGNTCIVALSTNIRIYGLSAYFP